MGASELLTSAEAARLAGVGPTAIKRWADAGTLPCIRTAGGHRRFRREDLERLLSRGQGRQPDEWADWIDILLAESDTYAVQARLFEERARRGSWHAVAEALGDLLVEIGRRWERGRLSVFEEHLASSALQRALTAVVEGMPVPLAAPRCLLASAEGETHTLGLSLVELCLREAGWRSEWLGAHTRSSDVVDRLSRGPIAMVALSASASATDPAPLAASVDEIGAACRKAGVALAIGGAGAWPEVPRFGRRFRALREFRDYAAGLKDQGLKARG